MPIADPPNREAQPEGGARDPRIEPLLLAGLDRYFAGEFEHAIQVWSRVFFRDRGHARARAYIERARGALAERQREAEARMLRSHGARSAPYRSSPEDLNVTVLPRREADSLRDSGAFARRDWQAGAGSASAARAAAPTLDLEPEPAVGVSAGSVATEIGACGAAAPRRRLIAHALLIALAAALLFMAGYVVAARDELATWWNAPGEAVAVPAAAPAAGASDLRSQSGSARVQGSAAR